MICKVYLSSTSSWWVSGMAGTVYRYGQLNLQYRWSPDGILHLFLQFSILLKYCTIYGVGYSLWCILWIPAFKLGQHLSCLHCTVQYLKYWCDQNLIGQCDWMWLMVTQLSWIPWGSQPKNWQQHGHGTVQSSSSDVLLWSSASSLW